MNNQNIIELKSIRELLDYQFYIPSYQRGYRWEVEQVTELLEDIWTFSDLENKGAGEFYCLQPVVVKKENDKYRLVDGQQRLTSLYIILSYFDAEAELLFGSNKKYSLEYETRPDSKTFLESIKDIQQMNTLNIDYYFMSQTFLTIKEWFIDNKVNKVEFLNTLLNLKKDEQGFDRANNVKVIWYELGGHENEIDVFTRINSGKIPLTNAELIKALFLNSKNFDEDTKKLKQIEIAKEWDEIEATLQNDEFWLFLRNEKDYSTRIEIIFEIFANIPIRDKYDVYRYFVGQKNLISLWSDTDKNIKKVFLSLKYWFENRKLYHLTGFLIATGYSAKQIYKNFELMSKSEFTKDIYSHLLKDIDINSIEELEYGKDNPKIHRVLLLFNIATILNNKESYIRFAFDKFNSEQWTLEHIHAQKDKGLISSDIRREWLKRVDEQIHQLENIEKFQDITDSILMQLQKSKIEDDSHFVELQYKIFEIFGESDINTIDNLALLSSQVNTALSNNIFPIKREILKEKDKLGAFIPIATKNVFLKYYSQNTSTLYSWDKDDRKAYIEEIKNTLIKFLGDENE